MVPLFLSQLESLDSTGARIGVPDLIDKIDGLLAHSSVRISGPQHYRLKQRWQSLHHRLELKSLLQKDRCSLQSNEVDRDVVLLKAVLEDQGTCTKELFVLLDDLE